MSDHPLPPADPSKTWEQRLSREVPIFGFNEKRRYDAAATEKLWAELCAAHAADRQQIETLRKELAQLYADEDVSICKGCGERVQWHVTRLLYDCTFCGRIDGSAIHEIRQSAEAQCAALTTEVERLQKRVDRLLHADGTMLDAFDQGLAAAGAGKTKDANPYDPGDSWGVPMQRQYWDDGFDLGNVKAIAAERDQLRTTLAQLRQEQEKVADVPLTEAQKDSADRMRRFFVEVPLSEAEREPGPDYGL